jgi:ParB family transcriptional regulator, chromosome partitioning protein
LQNRAADCGRNASPSDHRGGNGSRISDNSRNSLPLQNRANIFDVWQFATADDDAGTPSYFGKLPPQIIENLLWLYTEPGQIVVDPFAGGGTVIDVAKRMGRRVWASDRCPATPTLPIHAHDITTGWPSSAPAKADFILLDPP